jgi:hypothetical protein
MRERARENFLKKVFPRAPFQKPFENSLNKIAATPLYPNRPQLSFGAPTPKVWRKVDFALEQVAEGIALPVRHPRRTKE